MEQASSFSMEIIMTQLLVSLIFHHLPLIINTSFGLSFHLTACCLSCMISLVHNYHIILIVIKRRIQE